MTPKELNEFADKQLEIKQIKKMITENLLTNLTVGYSGDSIYVIAQCDKIKFRSYQYVNKDFMKLVKEAVKQLKKENE